MTTEQSIDRNHKGTHLDGLKQIQKLLDTLPISKASVLVFKTDICNEPQIKVAKAYLDENSKIRCWNFDLEDIDNILRVESEYDVSGEIVAGMERLGFWCEELE
jgi:hypothetical protein